MKVAFATEDLESVNAHFGWAKNISIYELDDKGYELYDNLLFDGDLKEDGNEDKLNPKIEAIRDCALLYVAAIGGSAAARVVASKVHPVKVKEPQKITEILDKLKDVLNGTPPPWLRKAFLKDQKKDYNFEEDDNE